ncbi:MAG TPA: glycosyl hydrolase 115 family protein, partial [Chitinophagaceae bacterium]|nr:glycosyl hydrolase 115 family protein [Chitinophagaceae bacterium]
MKRFKVLVNILLIFCQVANAQGLISEKVSTDNFFIASSSQSTTIIYDERDSWLIQKVCSLLQQDMEMLTGNKPSIQQKLISSIRPVIIVGTIEGSSMIRQLIREKKIDVTRIRNKWEAFQLTTLTSPFKGSGNILVITGSDRRGTAFGVFELSRQMGVSPWYWWADVPMKNKANIYIKKGTHVFSSPSVKYRGIFINDEAPAFSGWAKEKFGGVNHHVYEKIFELLLRLKANYLWPAMWGNAFNDDDTLNPILADKWGIVMGTSHHEPMLRAQQEWKRYGKGQWNYDSNEVVLKNFWRKGIQNMGNHESIVTIGMRGDGDMPMTRGTATQLLERIVSDQRKIIAEVTGKDASLTPQLWA